MALSLVIKNLRASKPLLAVQPQTRKMSTVKYTPFHEWVKIDEKDPSVGVVGISKFCADTMREVINVSRLPKPGDKLKKEHDRIASVESYKAEVDFTAPISGEVLEVDQAVSSNPNLVINEPTSNGWLLKVKMTNAKELDDLLDEQAYSKLCKKIETAPGNTGFEPWL